MNNKSFVMAQTPIVDASVGWAYPSVGLSLLCYRFVSQFLIDMIDREAELLLPRKEQEKSLYFHVLTLFKASSISIYCLTQSKERTKSQTAIG